MTWDNFGNAPTNIQYERQYGNTKTGGGCAYYLLIYFVAPIVSTLIVYAGEKCIDWLFSSDNIPDNSHISHLVYQLTTWMYQYPVFAGVVTVVLCIAAVLFLTIALVGLVAAVVQGVPDAYRESVSHARRRSGTPSPVNKVSLGIAFFISIVAIPIVQPWFHSTQPTAVAVAATPTPTQIVPTPTPTPTQVPPTPTLVPTLSPTLPYQTNRPGSGSGCISDSYWTQRGSGGITCTDDSMVMSATGDKTNDVFDEAAFDPRQFQGVNSLAPYCVQVTASFLTTDAGAAILIGVHGQNPGGQVVQFFQNGDLAMLRFPHTGDSDPSAIRPGKKFYAESPYHLAVGVEGDTITVWVNQQEVASATDSTYHTTDYVFIGLKADATTSSPTTDMALFTDFVFQPGTISGCGS